MSSMPLICKLWAAWSSTFDTFCERLRQQLCNIGYLMYVRSKDTGHQRGLETSLKLQGRPHQGKGWTQVRSTRLSRPSFPGPSCSAGDRLQHRCIAVFEQVLLSPYFVFFSNIESTAASTYGCLHPSFVAADEPQFCEYCSMLPKVA